MGGGLGPCPFSHKQRMSHQLSRTLFSIEASKETLMFQGADGFA
jgi:hypothetical protein